MSALGQKQTFALQKAMSVLPPKADMCSATRYVRFVPIADIDDLSGAAATAGERGVSLSACVLQRWRHSRGSDCPSRDCLPKHSVGIVQSSCIGSPSTCCHCRNSS